MEYEEIINLLRQAVAALEEASGMQMTEAQRAEAVEEMEEKMEEVLPEDEEKRKSLTTEQVEDLIVNNMSALMPKRIAEFVSKSIAKDTRRYAAAKTAVEKTAAPARSAKFQVPPVIGRAEAPSVGSFVKHYVQNRTTPDWYKAQNPYIGTLGGFLLGQELAAEVLEPLGPKVVMFNAGVKQRTVSGAGAYILPRMTTRPSTFRPGINQAITGSEGKFDTVTAFLRPIACMIDIPRQMLSGAIIDLNTWLQTRMREEIARQIDKEILVGVNAVTGSNTGAEITGILTALENNSTLATTNAVTLATNGREAGFDDLVNATTQVSVGNVPLDANTSGWVMHPSVLGSLQRLTATTGEPLLFPRWSSPADVTIAGYKHHVSTQVPIDVTTGTSTDTSYIFFGN